jgi:hypothetical protein
MIYRGQNHYFPINARERHATLIIITKLVDNKTNCSVQRARLIELSALLLAAISGP